MQIVDTHPHIVSKDTARYPITPIGGKRSDWSDEHSVPMQEMIGAMDEAGVSKAAMVHSSTTYGFECNYVADEVAKHADRFTGVFSVNVLDPDGPRLMRQWHGKGCTGQRIFTRGSTMKTPWLALDDPRIDACYAIAEELRITVATNATLEVVPQIQAVLKRFPKVNFLLDHMGAADFDDGPLFEKAAPLWKLTRYPNLHLKITSYNFARMANQNAAPAAVIAKVVAEYGAPRIAWGSNYPASHGSLKNMVDMAKTVTSDLPATDQEWILGGTALKLYPVLA